MHYVAVRPKGRDPKPSRDPEDSQEEVRLPIPERRLDVLASKNQMVCIGPNPLSGAYLCQLRFDDVCDQNQNEDQQG